MSQSKDFDIEDVLPYENGMLVILALGDRNPGAYTVVTKLFEIVESDETTHDTIMNLIQQLMIKKIIGARLWYIYKNEAKLDINNLLHVNLDQFTDEYFYERFEKYTTNC
jgi:hypothetical protein